MNRNLSMIFGILFVVSQIATFTNSDPNVDGAIDGDNDDYSNPNEDYGNEYENEYGNGNGNGNNVDSFASTEAAGSDGDSGSTLTPDSTVASYLVNDGVASDLDMDSFNDSTNVSKNDSNIPLPIIIVFVFMFTVLGVICIQQLQRMFAENKEYNNIKFEIRENRPASRSGKSYGTVTYGNSRNNNKNKNKRKNNRNKPKFDMNIENDMDSFQNDRNTIVTILSETDEKVAESTHARLKRSNNNNGNGGYSSDDSIELGSGYDSNAMDGKQQQQMKDDCDENGNTVMNSMKLTDKQKEMIAATRAKTSAKLKEQMKVATQGIKDKIEQKLHVSKLNTSKNKYKGYGTVDNNNDDSDNNDNDNENDNNETNGDNSNNTNNTTGAATTTSHISLKDKLKRTLQRSSKNSKNNNEEDDDSDESDIKHPGYTMNYGYSEDYDCDFEDSDTQLSAEGDDNLNVNNETVLKRVVLE